MDRQANFTTARDSRRSLLLLGALLALLWCTGGAARADVSATVFARLAAWTILVIAVWSVPLPRWAAIRPVALVLAAAVLVVASQLVPLPPALWSTLPGRALFLQATEISGQPQVWRPLSMAPDATVNALMSLVVPLAVLWLAGSMDSAERRRVAAIIVGLALLGVLVAAFQFSGAGFDNPLLNEPRGAVSGNFANRNHFALLLAIACLLTPVVVADQRRLKRWRGLGAIAILALLTLTAVATGSRVGVALSFLGSILGLLLVRDQVAAEVQGLSRGAIAGLVAVPVLVIGGLIAISLYAGRAVSVDRAVALGADDERFQFLPVVLQQIGRYWPAGTGFGTFDPVFRITEPDFMLSTRFLNHAHNEFLELVLDGGAVGAAVMIAAVAYLGWKGLRAIRASDHGPGEDRVIARAGGGVLLLMAVASLFEYPARTPLILAIGVLACVWLTSPRPPEGTRRERTVMQQRAIKTALAVVFVILGSMTVTRSFANVIVRADPERAHALWPSNGRIAGTWARAMLSAQLGSDAESRAADLARSALRRDATSVDAVAALAAQAQLHGDTARARRLFTYSEGLTRRDLSAQLWQIEESVGRGDIVGALRHYDIALRVSPRSHELLFPILSSAIKEPTVRNRLVQVLTELPSWSNDLLSYMAASGRDPIAAVGFFNQLAHAGIAASDVQRSRLVTALFDAGHADAAWAYFASFHPNADPRTSRNADFSPDGSGVTPFGWNLASDSSAAASIQSNGSSSALEFSIPAGMGGHLVQQAQVLPPGSYRIEGVAKSITRAADSQLYWTVTCADGREIGRAIVPPATDAGQPFSQTFTVPAGCPLQAFQLIAGASGTDQNMMGQITQARIRPVAS